MRSDLERELRRRQSILSTTGLGVIAFGLWTFIKPNMYFLLGGDKLSEGVEPDPVLSRGVLFAASYILCMIIACILLLIHVRVGRGAIAEAKDAQKRCRYLGLAIAMIVICIASVATDLFTLRNAGSSLPDYVASMLVDATQTVMYAELVASAGKVRSIRHELRKEAG